MPRKHRSQSKVVVVVSTGLDPDQLDALDALCQKGPIRASRAAALRLAALRGLPLLLSDQGLSALPAVIA